MKQNLLLLWLLLGGIASQAQNGLWAPAGAHWAYTFSSMSGTPAVLHLSYVGEGNYAGRRCQKLVRAIKTQAGAPQGGVDTVYTSADANQVSVYANGQFYKLYDFSAAVGDTWTSVSNGSGQSWCVPAAVTVTNTGQQVVAGQMRRWFTATYRLTGIPVDLTWGPVYEGIGPLSGFVSPPAAYNVCGRILTAATGELLCFGTSGQPGLYSAATATNCSSILMSVAKRPATTSTVAFPNPSTGNVSLTVPAEYRSAAATVYDLTGRQCWHGPLPTAGKLDLRGLPKGVYLLSVAKAGMPTLTQRLLLH
ncbi:T9SS type A sorting domain-containing protein [Hymenobacter busanensis]|nr:T9SS type A sorting domain-containing protein [Hymenobacter busanensis]QHJ06959.1 T9SS type A sorting domain-containing protein [Hymenobacter busanensis]